MPYPIVETHAELIARFGPAGCACRCGARDCASRRTYSGGPSMIVAASAPRYPMVEWFAGEEA